MAKESLESVVEVTMRPCLKCGGKRYRYNPLGMRKRYKGEIIVGKYECLVCGKQFNWN